MREHSSECPMDALLRILMGPWTTYILWILRSEGPTRFGELKRKVPGISAKVLTERLRMLEGAGLISRHHEPTIPPQVTYALAARGQELSSPLDSLNAIARRWREEVAAKAKEKDKETTAAA
jgi:DNA-binding HxlR family transcriptional regulator